MADFLHQGHDTPEEAFDLDPEVVTEERERDEPASTRVREDDEARVDECPTCGSPVEVVTSDEGTSHYRPEDSDVTRADAPSES